MSSKKKLILVLAGLVLALVCVFIFLKMKTSANTSQQLPAAIKLKTFQGTNPPFNFTFEYPEVWKSGEMRLSDLDIAQVKGPQDKTTKVIPGIFFKVKKMKETDDLSKQAEAMLQKEGRMRDFKKLGQEKTQIGGMQALRLDYQYVVPLPIESVDPQNTVLRRAEILITRKGMAYQISAWMTEEQYKIYQSIFDHMTASFKFLD